MVGQIARLIIKVANESSGQQSPEKSMVDLMTDLRKALESSLATMREIHRTEMPTDDASAENFGLRAWEESITRMVAALYRSCPPDTQTRQLETR